MNIVGMILSAVSRRGCPVWSAARRSPGSTRCCHVKWRSCLPEAARRLSGPFSKGSGKAFFAVEPYCCGNLFDGLACLRTVAGTGPGTQSRALAVDVDKEGRYLVAGFTCGDICAPDGEIRVYLPGGAVDWLAPLGPLNSDFAGPHDIAWSPAGYMVIALAEMDDMALRFKVQAYAPGKLAPLWTYFPDDEQGLQIALALAIGPFGEVYAGGIGSGNFPAVAYIAG